LNQKKIGYLKKRLYITTKMVEEHLEIYALIRHLIRSLRLFQSESIFCEGITFTQYTILDYVSRNQNTGMTELGKFLDVEKSTTTRLVNALIAKKYLEKSKNQNDLRETHLRLTATGEKKNNLVRICMARFLEDMLKKMDKKTKSAMISSISLFSGLVSDCCRKTHCQNSSIRNKNEQD